MAERRFRLTEDERQAWQRDGFFLRENVFSGDENDLLNTVAEEIVAGTRAFPEAHIDRNALVRDGTEQRSGIHGMHKIHFPSCFVAEFLQRVRDPRLTDPIVDLLGPDVLGINNLYIWKAPEIGLGFPWHQDMFYFRQRFVTETTVGTWTAVDAADRTGKPMASMAIAPTARAAYSRVACHWTAPISHCIPGTTANVPNDPAAVTIPKAVPRLFSGTTCATAPRMTTYDVALSARPTITPSPRYSVAVEAASDSSANPTAYRAAPTTITQRGPMRSAIMPASGSPNMMFCTAIDRLNVSRPVDRVAVIGCRNSPNDCRAPMATATVRAPSTMTSAGRFMTPPSIPDRTAPQIRASRLGCAGYRLPH